ncbi:ABC transporter substrate-binding protein [Chloroflexota bacterium]
MRKRHLLVAGVITLALVTLVASCTPEAPTPAPEEKPVTVRAALSTFGTDSLDPIKTSSLAARHRLIGVLYDTLIGLGPDGKMSKETGVAEDWEMSEDGETWTFHIRKGVQFHEGWGEVTAEDVKFSLERSHSEASQTTQGAVLSKWITEIETPDDYTVKIHTDGAKVYLPGMFSPRKEEGVIYSKKYLMEKAGADWEAQVAVLDEHPIGSGPFTFVERKKGDYMLFEAFEDYWRGKPDYEFLEMVLVPEAATQINMLRAREIDIIPTEGVMVESAKQAGEVRGIPLSLDVYLLCVGPWWPGVQEKGLPTANAKVRKALDLAINKQEIVDSLFAGYGSIPLGPARTIPAMLDFDTDYWKKYYDENHRYDPERAKELLAEAGYPGGGDFSDIKFYAYKRGNAPWIPSIVEAIVGYWSQIGVMVEIVPIDYGAWRPHWIRPEFDDQMSGGQWMLNASTVKDFPSDALAGSYASTAGAHYVNNERLDKLALELIPGELDAAKRKELVTEAFMIAEEEGTVFAICFVDALYAVNPDKIGEWQTCDSHSTLGPVWQTIKVKR